MVMGRDCGFESLHNMDIFSQIVVEIVMFVGKTKINYKEAGVGPFKMLIR